MNLRALSDTALIRRYLEEGDERAFTVLHDRHRPNVLDYLSRKLRNPDIAEDVAQEVFIKVWEHLGKFDTSEEFGPWVKIISRNLALNYRRDSRLDPTLVWAMLTGADDAEDRVRGDELSPEEVLERKSLLVACRKALEGLPDIYRVVLDARYERGLLYREIAEEMGMNLETVKTRIRRGRALLREAVGPWT